MLRCEEAEPVDLLVGRPAPESSDRLVLTADPVVVVVVVVVVMVVIVVAGAEAEEPRLPLPDPFLLLSHPRQLISRRVLWRAAAVAGVRGSARAPVRATGRQARNGACAVRLRGRAEQGRAE